jgi:hypothetical protein
MHPALSPVGFELRRRLGGKGPTRTPDSAEYQLSPKAALMGLDQLSSTRTRQALVAGVNPMVSAATSYGPVLVVPSQKKCLSRPGTSTN